MPGTGHGHVPNIGTGTSARHGADSARHGANCARHKNYILLNSKDCLFLKGKYNYNVIWAHMMGTCQALAEP